MLINTSTIHDIFKRGTYDYKTAIRHNNNSKAI